MKVVGQSTIAVTPPYLHVGYLATTVLDMSKPLTDAGVGLVVLGLVLGAWKGIRAKRLPPGGVSTYSLSLRRPSVWVAGWLLVSCVGAGILLWGPEEYTRKLAAPERLSRARVRGLYSDIMFRCKDGLPVPDSLRGLLSDGDDHAPTIVDAWNNEMRIQKLAGEGEESFRIASAGPDGVFDTLDDIVYPREGEPVEDE
ncbi:MAG: hypothetical protein JXO22_01930 [Phycisphaerae bacterium]|nr:hypothetical protein [Phycisphaerae bacterium]